MSLRRKRLPSNLQESHRAFEDVLAEIERAKAALTEAVPGARMPGRPLAEALMAFEDGLRSAELRMDLWWDPQVERVWLDASTGLRETLALAERLRVEGVEPVGFEGLIGSIGDLLAPLEAFGVAADRFGSLRTSRT